MINPFTAPHASPVKTDISMIARRQIIMIQLSLRKAYPQIRSLHRLINQSPAVIITNVTPIAIMPVTEASRKILNILSAVKKESLVTPNTSIIITNDATDIKTPHIFLSHTLPPAFSSDR